MTDVFGPLAACSNCEKTKKTCTFEWLRSQRVSQAAQTQNSPAPPTKRRRTHSNSSASQPDKDSSRPARASESDVRSTVRSSRDRASERNPAELGITFADFPSAFDSDAINLFRDGPSNPLLKTTREQKDRFDYLSILSQGTRSRLNPDSSQGSLVETLEEDDEVIDSDTSQPNYRHSNDSSSRRSHKSVATLRINKKRRCRSPSLMSNSALTPLNSLANDLNSSTNNAYLTEGLLKIYHNSFENALACWLTERTCPSTAVTDMVKNSTSSAPNWSQIYHRVFRLDRLASSVRGRQLTFTEDRSASKALNTAIYAFASQWAQSSQRSTATYPFSSSVPQGGNMFSDSDGKRAKVMEFDRRLQISAWHEARKALQDAGEVESFRVVLAEIVFALTQKPLDEDDKKLEHVETPGNDRRFGLDTPGLAEWDSALEAKETDVKECEDLLSRLDLAMDNEGPPVHLEKGLRLIHSLRSRMAMSGANSRKKPGTPRRGKHYRSSASQLEPSDRATVDLLFWLGVMFDTLSAAMYKRPLVVSDEDSNMVALSDAKDALTSSQQNAISNKDSHWDDYLFACQQQRLHDAPTRWPCSFDQAAAALCNAAPVKVLLFRRVTRIQTLLARNAQGEKVEEAVEAAIEVCNHWDMYYAPFIQDCIWNHDQLPPRIQSWYICLTGHWHLATLLLGDLIEIIDESELGVEEAKHEREMTAFLANFREKNSQALSCLARCACPREDASFPDSKEFHFAVNQGALLTEPWTAVLIRAFAKAGVLLLEFEAMLPMGIAQEDAFQRADYCVRALWYLGRKSDMALATAKILGEALKERRSTVPERVDHITAFLEGQGWHGFENFEDPFGLDCGP